MKFNDLKEKMIALSVPRDLFKTNSIEDLKEHNMRAQFKLLITKKQMPNDDAYMKTIEQVAYIGSGSFNKTSIIKSGMLPGNKKYILRVARDSTEDVDTLFSSYYENIKHIILYLCYNKHKIIPKIFRIGLYIDEKDRYVPYCIIEGADTTFQSYLELFMVNNIIGMYDQPTLEILEDDMRLILPNYIEFIKKYGGEDKTTLRSHIDRLIDHIINEIVKPSIYVLIYFLTELNYGDTVIEFKHNDLKFNNVVVTYEAGEIDELQNIFIIDFGTCEFIIRLDEGEVQFKPVHGRSLLYGRDYKKYNIVHDIIMFTHSIIMFSPINNKAENDKTGQILDIFNFTDDKCKDFFIHLETIKTIYRILTRIGSWNEHYSILVNNKLDEIITMDKVITDKIMKNTLNMKFKTTDADSELILGCININEQIEELPAYEKKYMKYKMKYLKLKNNIARGMNNVD